MFVHNDLLANLCDIHFCCCFSQKVCTIYLYVFFWHSSSWLETRNSKAKKIKSSLDFRRIQINRYFMLPRKKTHKKKTEVNVKPSHLQKLWQKKLKFNKKINYNMKIMRNLLQLVVSYNKFCLKQLFGNVVADRF